MYPRYWVQFMLFRWRKCKEEVPAIAYVLGDEGSGAYYGKKLLRDYLYNKLPAEIKYGLENELNITKAAIFERVYMKPHANVYLASFMKFISKFKGTSYVTEMVKDGMDEFIKIHVCCYPESKSVRPILLAQLVRFMKMS